MTSTHESEQKAVAQASTATQENVTAIVQGYHGTPFSVLGPHAVTIEGVEHFVIRAFRPLDDAVFVLEPANGQRHAMQCVNEAGLFEIVFPKGVKPLPYRLIAVDPQGNEHDLEDPYRFPPLLTDFDLHLFGEGNFWYSYEKLGAHFRTVDGVLGVNFAVWAPNAERVSVIGEFNGMGHRTHPMRRHEGIGIWEIFIPNLPEGIHYKFAVQVPLLGL